MYLQCFACKVRYLDIKNLFGSVGKRGVDLFDILLLLLFFFPLKCYGWEKLLSTNDLAFNLHTCSCRLSGMPHYKVTGETNLCSSSAPIWTIWYCNLKAASSSSSSSQWGVLGLRKFRFKDLHVCLQNFVACRFLHEVQGRNHERRTLLLHEKKVWDLFLTWMSEGGMDVMVWFAI